MKKNIIRIVLIILILCWMYIVFGFSNTGGQESTSLSMGVAKIFVKNEIYLEFVENIIRKFAHLTEYALGAVLIYTLFLTYKINPKIQFVLSWIIVCIYAITDEIHQLFIPGRAGRIVDVYIDSLGALIGMCCMLLLVKIVKTKKKI